VIAPVLGVVSALAVRALVVFAYVSVVAVVLVSAGVGGVSVKITRSVHVVSSGPFPMVTVAHSTGGTRTVIVSSVTSPLEVIVVRL
jgi:hypothetical protein